MSESGTEEPNVDFDAALAKFGAEMMALYVADGAPTYAQLGRSLPMDTRGRRRSPGSIGDVLNGKKLPSEEFARDLVRLLKADPEAERRLVKKRNDLFKLRKAAGGTAVGREDPAVLYDQLAAELSATRAERDKLNARVNRLTGQKSVLEGKIAKLTKRASQLEQALYTNWPLEGVRLEGPHGATSVTFHPDGQTLAVGYRDGTVRIWDPDSAELRTIARASHPAPVHCVGYCDNGDVLVAGGGDGTVRLVDPRTGHPLGEPLAGSDEPVMAVAFSSRRKTSTKRWHYSLAAGDRAGAVRIWQFSDVPRGDAQFTFPAGGPVQSLAFAPDHDLLVVGTEHARVTVCGHDGSAVPDGASMLGFTGKAAVRSLCFGSGNDVLAVGDAEGRVHLLALSAGEPFIGKQRDKLEVGFPIKSVAASPKRPLLAIGGADGLTLWEFDTPTREVPRINAAVLSVAFRPPDGELIAIGMADGSTQLHAVAKVKQQLSNNDRLPRPRERPSLRNRRSAR